MNSALLRISARESEMDKNLHIKHTLFDKRTERNQTKNGHNEACPENRRQE